MKKILKFIAFSAILSMVLLVFFACKLQIPSGIQVVGNPEIRFSANMDIGEKFREEIEDIFNRDLDDDLELVECTGTYNQTYLIYSELLKETIKMEEPDNNSMPDEFQDFLYELGIELEDHGFYTLQKDEVLLYSTMTIPLEDIGEILPGFRLKKTTVKLFISGDGDLIEILALDLNINGVDEDVDLMDEKSSGRYDGDIDLWADGYSGDDIPAYGIIIDLDNHPIGEDVVIIYRLYIPEGVTIDNEDLLKTADILVEAVIWLPLELVAGEDGAEFIIPEMFGEGEDLFGRSDPDADFILYDVVDTLSLEITLNHNPFSTAELMVTSGDIIIKNPLTGSALYFTIDEEKMEEINDPANFPFAPQIGFFFVEGEELLIPRDFDLKAHEIIFRAKVNYLIEF